MMDDASVNCAQIARLCLMYHPIKALRRIFREALAGSRYTLIQADDIEFDVRVLIDHGFHVESLADMLQRQQCYSDDEIQLATNWYKVSWGT